MERNTGRILVVVLFVFLFTATNLFSFPLEFTDSSGKKIVIKKPPERVVSLVPSITEALYDIGAGDKIKGVTYHSVASFSTNLKPVVGGFFSPSVDKIQELKPEIIFISDLHHTVVDAYKKTLSKTDTCILINFNHNSIDNSFKNLTLLGKIFNKEKETKKIIEKNDRELSVIKRKTDKITDKKRVIRLMGREKVMTPGDDSFQNEMIQMAGGIPPKTGQNGKIVTMTMKQWQEFNPQVIYGCGDDRSVFDTILKKPGWNEVDAVKNNTYLSFPCELTCRASTNVGYFTGWLAAGVYPEAFSEEKKQVEKERVVETKNLSVDLAYIQKAEVKREYIHDFINKTLVIELKKPMAIVSTLEGYRQTIEKVGNHYFPTQTWGLGHSAGLKHLRERTYSVLDLKEKNASFLFTGADMDNLAITTKEFKKMKIVAFVTAGVRGNALKMSKDNGGFYEPGTINIIIMTNMKLTQRAMTRAIISVTEAKSAALADMDIRSSYSPLKHQATGTGTDNVLVVEGDGSVIDNAGGHSKMGELIAKAVYDGVKEAVLKQNGIAAERNIFQRLKERKINISALTEITGCDCNIEKSRLNAEFETTLLDPFYRSFFESAFTISDDYERGIINNIDSFAAWSEEVAREIAGKDDIEMRPLVEQEDIPVVLKTALNAVINGIVNKL